MHQDLGKFYSALKAAGVRFKADASGWCNIEDGDLQKAKQVAAKFGTHVYESAEHTQSGEAEPVKSLKHRSLMDAEDAVEEALKSTPVSGQAAPGEDEGAGAAAAKAGQPKEPPKGYDRQRRAAWIRGYESVKKHRSLKALVLKRVKRFVVKTRKGYLKKGIDIGETQLEEPLTKDLDEAEHMDEKSAKRLVAKMAEGEWPDAKAVEDLTNWEDKGNPPSGPDSMGNASSVEDTWPGVDSSEANVSEVAKALEDEGMDEEKALRVAKAGIEACCESDFDPEKPMKALRKAEDLDEDEEKALRKALKRVSKRFVVRTRKGFVYKSGTVASADDAEEFTRSKAEEVAEERDGEVEEKGIESAAEGQLDPEDPMKALRKSKGAKQARLAATVAKRLKVKVCKDCVGEKALCSKCVKAVLKADPLEGMGEDEQGVPVGLRSLRKLCKAVEDEMAKHEFGPVKEACEMALKVLGKTRTKLYKDLESEDEVEKALEVGGFMPEEYEMKSEEPPTIEEKSDGFCVKRGDKTIAGPFKSKSQAVDAFRVAAFKRVKRSAMTAKVRKALVDTKALLAKAMEEDELSDGLKGLVMLKAKELDDALGEEKSEEDEMGDFEMSLFKAKAAEMEDQLKALDSAVRRSVFANN
jgi:hypothetical protein